MAVAIKRIIFPTNKTSELIFHLVNRDLDPNKPALMSIKTMAKGLNAFRKAGEVTIAFIKTKLLINKYKGTTIAPIMDKWK